MSQHIWVVVETLRGVVSEISYTMLAAGRALADGLGGRLTGPLSGHNTPAVAPTASPAARLSRRAGAKVERPPPGGAGARATRRGGGWGGGKREPGVVCWPYH